MSEPVRLTDERIAEVIDGCHEALGIGEMDLGTVHWHHDLIGAFTELAELRAEVERFHADARLALTRVDLWWAEEHAELEGKYHTGDDNVWERVGRFRAARDAAAKAAAKEAHND